jgi:hypothetical protein
LVEDFVEGKDGGVIDVVADEPIVAEGTADFARVEVPVEVVDVVGAREEGTDCFDDSIEVYRRCWERLTSCFHWFKSIKSIKSIRCIGYI